MPTDNANDGDLFDDVLTEAYKIFHLKWNEKSQVVSNK